MIFKFKKLKHGDLRDRTFFAWFPYYCGDNTWVWFEKIKVQERYIIPIKGRSKGWYCINYKVIKNE